MSEYTIAFENESYLVVVSDDLELMFLGNQYIGGYEVINKKTKVCEFMTTSLPEAMFNAEQLHGALVSEAWKWRRDPPMGNVPATPNPLVTALN